MERYAGKTRREITAQGPEETELTPNSLTFDMGRRMGDKGYYFLLKGIDKDGQPIELSNEAEIRNAIRKLLGSSGRAEIHLEADGDLVVTKPGGPDAVDVPEVEQPEAEQRY